MKLAKESLDIPLYDKVTVADENNDPVVFDAKVIPDGTKLFMGVNGGDYMPEIRKFEREEDWRKWDRTENDCHIMNDGRTANFTGDKGFSFSKILPDKGKFIAWI